MNTVSVSGLMNVHGIGLKLATAICKYRPFDCWKDVETLEYVGPIRLIALKTAFSLDEYWHCMGVSHAGSDATFVLLDGGSDDHCARPCSGGDKQLSLSTFRLRDAVTRSIVLD